MKLEQSKIAMFEECPRIFKWKRILPIEREIKMLDKTKIYDVYVNNFNKHKHSSTRQKVKILFEDEIGCYVESTVQFDSNDVGIRWAHKKAFYHFVEVQIPGKADVCKNCKLLHLWCGQ